jgi:hypothetical protein
MAKGTIASRQQTIQNITENTITMEGYTKTNENDDANC